MVAIITKNTSIGTNMEIFFDSYVLKRQTKYTKIEKNSPRSFLIRTTGRNVFKSI